MQRSRLAQISASLFAIGLLFWGAHGAALSWIYVRIEPPAPTPLPPITGLPNSSASTCAGCHPDHYEEWQGSKMGQAMTDPIFLLDFNAQGRPFVCLRCHAPLDAQQPERITGLKSLIPLEGAGLPNPDHNADLQREGVTCVACHQVEGKLVAGIEHPKGAPHPAKYDAEFRKSGTCARCHQLAPPPLSGLDRPLPDTVAEHRRWQAKTGRAEECVDCHMTPVQRPAALGGPIRANHTHDFPGAWSDDLVRTSVTIEDIRTAPNGVHVTLQNHTGHALPAAEPSRALVIRLSRDNQTIAETALRRSIPIPRLRDEGDNRLRPNERRTILIPFGDGPTPTHVSVDFERLYSPAVPIPNSVVPADRRTVRIAHRPLP
ncbi:MAG: hypothetical protein GWP91_14810 [Rhodobacterales bacterium]|nr:hypothetical protein [Rhodobacterales bacterium]